MEDRSVAARAEAGVVNVLRRDSALGQQRSGEARKIDVRLRAAAIDKQFGIGIRLPKPLDDFLPHFEATRADGWTEKFQSNSSAI